LLLLSAVLVPQGSPSGGAVGKKNLGKYRVTVKIHCTHHSSSTFAQVMSDQTLSACVPSFNSQDVIILPSLDIINNLKFCQARLDSALKK